MKPLSPATQARMSLLRFKEGTTEMFITYTGVCLFRTITYLNSTR